MENETVWVIMQHSLKKANYGGDEIMGIYKTQQLANSVFEKVKNDLQKLSDDEAKNLIVSGQDATYYTLSEHKLY